MLAALLLVGVACQAAPIAPASAPPTSTAPTPASLVPTATTAVAATLTASPISTATRAPATATSEQALAFVPVPGRPSLLEFYEEGWGNCVIMQSIVHGLQERYGERVTFASAEIDDPAAASLIKQYRARGTPFIVLLGKDGQIAHRIYGVVEAGELTLWLDRLLQ